MVNFQNRRVHSWRWEEGSSLYCLYVAGLPVDLNTYGQQTFFAIPGHDPFSHLFLKHEDHIFWPWAYREPLSQKLPSYVVRDISYNGVFTREFNSQVSGFNAENVAGKYF